MAAHRARVPSRSACASRALDPLYIDAVHIFTADASPISSPTRRASSHCGRRGCEHEPRSTQKIDARGGSRNAAGRRRSSRRRTQSGPASICSNSRTVAGETAFQSATRGTRAGSPGRGGDRGGGRTRLRRAERSRARRQRRRRPCRDPAEARGRPAPRALLVRALRPARVATARAAARAVGGTDRTPHRSRADDADGLHNGPYESGVTLSARARSSEDRATDF